MTETVIISAILGSVGLLITLIYYYQSSKLSNDRMRKELFTEFNIRYFKIKDSLVDISKCQTIDELEKDSKLKNNLIDYFNLCAEEYFWYKKGRIDSLIWKAWSAGMNDWYKYPVIQAAWEKEIEEFDCRSYYIKDMNEFFLK